MANEEKEKTTITKPTSQLDLERRQSDDYVADADISSRVAVNPNPFGEEDYVGTDPVYQNYANDTEKPLPADEGPEAEAEKAHREMYDTDEDTVNDPGLGGEAVRADLTGPAAERYLVPGQEGYPDDASKFTGPAVPASAVEGNDTQNTSSESTDERQSETQGSSTPVPPSSATPKKK